MATLKNILPFFGIVLCFLGCGVFSSNLENSYHPIYFKKPYISPSISISPDDKGFAFTVIDKFDSVKLTRNHKLCIYNFQNDSSTLLLRSDTILFSNPCYSSNGSQVFFIAEYSKEWHINVYDIQKKLVNTLFHWKYLIQYMVVSPDNQIIYFQGPTNASYQNETFSSPRSSMNYALYCFNKNDSKLSRLNKSLHSVGKLYIDKTGENLYFKIFSDSVSGPFKLNLASNTLTNLTPDFNKNYPNLSNKQKRNLKEKYGFISPTPIPSDSDNFVFLFDGASIAKYYEKNGTMNRIYAISPYQRGVLREQIWWPAIFHKNEKLLLLKDTTDSEQNFIILNNEGQIEKTFRPSIAKYSDLGGN